MKPLTLITNICVTGSQGTKCNTGPDVHVILTQHQWVDASFSVTVNFLM